MPYINQEGTVVSWRVVLRGVARYIGYIFIFQGCLNLVRMLFGVNYANSMIGLFIAVFIGIIVGAINDYGWSKTDG